MERPRAKREREEEVLVWPDLVFIEFIAAVLFTLTFIVLSVFIDAPLLNRANPDITPNPSKAPWYFLNLQELLLHMDKAWAGVLVPTIALIFFAAIPYIDRSPEAQGVWFGTKYSGRMTVFTAAYATVVTWILVLFDAGKFEAITRWFPGLTPVQEQQSVQVSPGVFETQTFEVTKGFLSTKDLAKRWEWSIGKLDWPEDFDHIPIPFNDMSWIPWHGMNINLPTTLAEQILPLERHLPAGGAGHRHPVAIRLGEDPPRRLHRNVYGGDGRLPGPVGNRELLPRPGTGPHPALGH